MQKAIIRTASAHDLEFLEQLEAACFPEVRRSNRRSLRTSITSPSQTVWILEDRRTVPSTPIGAAILIHYRKSLRIYSIAILPQYQGRGGGDVIMQHTIEQGLLNGCETISLEADANNAKLINWYTRYGFEICETLDDYYAPGEPARRMKKQLFSRQDPAAQPGASNIIVMNDPKQCNWDIPDVEIVSANTYLTDPRFKNSERYRIFNLCNSYRTHSLGYYVSLLAAARNQKIIPGVVALKDFSNISIAQSVAEEIDPLIQRKLAKINDPVFDLDIIFGETTTNGFSDLASKLHTLFQIPFFKVRFGKRKKWRLQKVDILSFDDISREYPQAIAAFAPKYFKKKRFSRTQIKNYIYDLAILINPDEPTPPSCPLALEKFKDAAEKTGFYVEFITRQDYNRICEFDALFIRETTAVSNHTYKFARRAFTEGLVVIDDPWSILRCSNKIYLHERLARCRITQPKSWQFSKGRSTKNIPKDLPFPIVLKMPESSFSLGVHKVSNAQELQDKLTVMFKTTELVIAQEFIETAFDWRIGILDNAPLFACKYHMAHGHWQIYNWNHDEQNEFSGKHETLPLNQVPAHILKTAAKASSLIGNGLYGVDLKDIHGKAYVIEINDNPNIDAGVEDQVLEDEIYLRIMNSFFNRIEQERNQPRYLL